MCCYFDDLDLTDKYEYELNHDLVNIREFESIKDWHYLLDTYNSPHNNDYNHAAILDDLNWLKIIEIGLTAKEELGTLLADGEKDILLSEIEYVECTNWPSSSETGADSKFNIYTVSQFKDKFQP